MNAGGLWPDWQYMFFGDADLSYLIEIVIRTIIVYSYTLLLLRWIGGRGIAQMSIIEFLLVVALGSAVGDAMFYPDVPLVYALFVITLVVVINKVIDIGMLHHPRIRRVFAGATAAVIRNGVIDRAALERVKVNREELFEGLRQQGIGNVGRVTFGYLEPSGSFSFFRAKGTVIGLPIIPAWTVDPPAITSGSQNACSQCGTVADEAVSVCPCCGSDRWTDAVIEEDDQG